MNKTSECVRRTLLVLFFCFVFYYATHPSSDIENDESESISLNSVAVSNPTISIIKLKENDADKLIDLNNFKYLINQPSCYDFEESKSENSAKPPLIAVVLVHSAPNNLNKRNIIRDTWGQKYARVRLFFLLGAVELSSLQATLEQENHQFQDIIQGNFLDTYRNLTYKHVMALKWFNNNCPNVKFLLKMDDDVFLNTPVLYDLLETDYIDRKDFVFCYKRIREPVLRNFTKWMVTFDEYPDEYYPTYCPGYSIVYSNDTIPRFYQQAQMTKLFWIDDVHVTGTLTQHLNLNITSIEKYFLDREKINDLITAKINLSSIRPMFLFASPDLEGSEIKELWKIVKNSSNKKIFL